MKTKKTLLLLAILVFTIISCTTETELDTSTITTDQISEENSAITVEEISLSDFENLTSITEQNRNLIDSNSTPGCPDYTIYITWKGNAEYGQPSYQNYRIAARADFEDLGLIGVQRVLPIDKNKNRESWTFSGTETLPSTPVTGKNKSQTRCRPQETTIKNVNDHEHTQGETYGNDE